MAYNLGNVKPHVAAAANKIGSAFGVRTIYGYSFRTISGTNTLSDHALGLALDFMTYTDRTKGDAIANYARTNASALGVKYVIWNRRIWSVERGKEGWRPYSGANPHTDHVHVSFYSKAGTGNTTGGNADPAWWQPPIPGAPLLPGDPGDLIDKGKDLVEGVTEPVRLAGKLARFLLNPHTWIRFLLFVAGMWLLIIALVMMVKSAGAVETAKSTAKTAARAVARKTTTKVVQ